MSDKALRAGLIRLAHSHPEFRKDLLPIITACGVEGPMMGKFEEGKPADPTKNMSPEDAAEWKKQNELNKDKFKGATQNVSAGCEKLPEGGMRENCEKKQEEGDSKGKEAAKKSAARAVVRRSTSIVVNVLTSKPDQDNWGRLITGQMSLDFGGTSSNELAAVRFAAHVEPDDMGNWAVKSFTTQKSVSGGGADLLLGVLKAALQEAISAKGEALFGSSF